MHVIKLSIGIEGESSIEGFEKFCNHYDCTLQKKKRGEDFWTITSDNPLNFFWLGANINFLIGGILLETPAEKYLKPK